MNDEEVRAALAKSIVGHLVFGIERGVRRYIVPIVLGSLFLNVLIGWSVGSVFHKEQAYNAKSCAATRAHQQTVLDFWNQTAGFRQSHADHELGASKTWATIVTDFHRSGVGDRKALADISQVSHLWVQLSVDDRHNANRARSYVSELEADYDHTCDAQGVPTPRAVAR